MKYISKLITAGQSNTRTTTFSISLLSLLLSLFHSLSCQIVLPQYNNLIMAFSTIYCTFSIWRKFFFVLLNFLVFSLILRIFRQFPMNIGRNIEKAANVLAFMPIDEFPTPPSSFSSLFTFVFTFPHSCVVFSLIPVLLEHVAFGYTYSNY